MARASACSEVPWSVHHEPDRQRDRRVRLIECRQLGDGRVVRQYDRRRPVRQEHHVSMYVLSGEGGAGGGERMSVVALKEQARSRCPRPIRPALQPSGGGCRHPTRVAAPPRLRYHETACLAALPRCRGGSPGDAGRRPPAALSFLARPHGHWQQRLERTYMSISTSVLTTKTYRSESYNNGWL